MLSKQNSVLPFSSSELSEKGQNAEAKWNVDKAKTTNWEMNILLFGLRFLCLPCRQGCMQYHRETNLEFIYTDWKVVANGYRNL